MKSLFIILISLTTLSSCQKGDLPPKKEEPIAQLVTDNNGTETNSLMRVNVLQSSTQFKLQVNIEYPWVSDNMTVRVTHWDYNNGRTPMVIVGTEQYSVRNRITTHYRHFYQTQFKYQGKMQVDIINDSLGRVQYTRNVILTDSVGWTVNLDTTASALSGWVGNTRIGDVVPKHY